MKKQAKATKVPAVLFCRTTRHLVLTLCAGILLTSSARADVVIEKQNETLYYARVIGTISQSDYETLIKKVAAIQGDRSSPTIDYVLNSAGGSMDAALNIGRFLRKKKALALVEEGNICMSACVLVLAGAAHRKISGIVGLQRPDELADTKLATEGQTAKHNKLGSAARAYLTEMNVQAKLYDDMLLLPAEKVRVLSEESLARYGLVQDSISK